jgi:hypothetical protein
VVPEIPDDRYYSFELMSFDGDNFAYAGTRTTGQKGKNYAILGRCARFLPYAKAATTL